MYDSKDFTIMLFLICLTFAVANVKNICKEQLAETKAIKAILEEIYNK